MGYSVEQQAVVKASVADMREDAAKWGSDLGIYFYTKHPEHKEKFPHYKGKAVDSLPSVPSYAKHTTTAFSGMLDLVGKAGDSAALATAAKQIVADHVPRGGGHNSQEYEDLFVSWFEFMCESLGDSFDVKAREAWNAAKGVTLEALSAAL